MYKVTERWRCRAGVWVCVAGSMVLTAASASGAPASWVDRDSVCTTAAGAPAASASGAARPTLLVVLSPRMVYALREWPRLRDGALAMDFDVQGLRDPEVPAAEWRAAAAVAGLPELATWPPVSLSDWPGARVRNHWPMAWVRWQGRTHPWPILGVMPDAAWSQLLRQRLEDLQACPTS